MLDCFWLQQPRRGSRCGCLKWLCSRGDPPPPPVVIASEMVLPLSPQPRSTQTLCTLTPASRRRCCLLCLSALFSSISQGGEPHHVPGLLGAHRFPPPQLTPEKHTFSCHQAKLVSKSCVESALRSLPLLLGVTKRSSPGALGRDLQGDSTTN